MILFYFRMEGFSIYVSLWEGLLKEKVGYGMEAAAATSETMRICEETIQREQWGHTHLSPRDF